MDQESTIKQLEQEIEHLRTKYNHNLSDDEMNTLIHTRDERIKQLNKLKSKLNK